MLLLFMAWLGASPVHAAPKFPPLAGRVVDAANILTPAVEAQLDQQLAALQARTGDQLVVATVPDLQGYEIEDYGYQLGRAWGIGQRKPNNGAILLIAPKERRVRVEVGYGLEPILTDALSRIIIERDILPKFRAGDLAGGVVAGAAALVEQLSLDRGEARSRAAAARFQGAKESPDGLDSVGLGALVPLLIFGIWGLMAFGGHGHGRRQRHGSGAPLILWGPGSGGHRGRGSGGGFRGGGGSFGGGGASGGW